MSDAAESVAPSGQTPEKTRRGLPGGLTGNVLVSGVISAIVAGLISFYVAHWQSQDAANQAIASQQTQELGQLEQATRLVYQDAQSVVTYQLSCTKDTRTWDECGAQAPGFAAYSAAWQELSLDVFNISDQDVHDLVLRYETTANDAIYAPTLTSGMRAWLPMFSQEQDVIAKCGELIQGITDEGPWALGSG